MHRNYIVLPVVSAGKKRAVIMRLIIVSGRSGSGKSTALHVLEDSGFTCIDNLPTSMLPTLIEKIIKNKEKYYAVSIDARNSTEEILLLPNLVNSPAFEQLDYEIIFLDADDNVLLKRFSETRRRHPLSNKVTNLQAAITKEKTLLKPIIDVATIILDTSEMGYHDLRDIVKRHLTALEKQSMSLVFQSFGFKYGIPRDADMIFDVRCLPNPHWEPKLRSQTGQDQDVIDFLSKEKDVEVMFNDTYHFLKKWLPSFEKSNRSYMTVAIGCTGGQHRSVYLCDQLVKVFAETITDVQCQHRDLRL